MSDKSSISCITFAGTVSEIFFDTKVNIQLLDVIRIQFHKHRSKVRFRDIRIAANAHELSVFDIVLEKLVEIP